MLNALRLIPALQIIFTHEIEFDADSFVELTQEQYEALRRRGEQKSGRLYRIVPFEPKAIERTATKVTLELTIADDMERELLMDAVKFVYHASETIDKENPTFADRLEYLRPRLPPIVTQAAS